MLNNLSFIIANYVIAGNDDLPNLVSVRIPTYYKANKLVKTVQSVINQDYHNLEIDENNYNFLASITLD